MKNFTDIILNYANNNYENGWDVIVECWSRSEIMEETKNCRTETGAIKQMAKHVSAYKIRAQNCDY